MQTLPEMLEPLLRAWEAWQGSPGVMASHQAVWHTVQSVGVLMPLVLAMAIAAAHRLSPRREASHTLP